MTYSLSVSFSEQIEPQISDGPISVCQACCALSQLRNVEFRGEHFVEAFCPHHPSILIQGSKVVGTSA